MIRIYFVLVLLLPFSLSAQLEFHRSNDLPVSDAIAPLDHAWAGGLNTPQWSTLDLNIDGHQDLVVFDRTSEQIQTYLWDAIAGEYVLSFDYANKLPPIRDWMLIRDFNCDGQKDIFTYEPGGIRVFENTSSNGELTFELRSSLLQSYYDFGSAPYYSNLYVSAIDIPSIADFDGDGDLDIHTFTLSGITIEYHQNMAVELGNCDSLAFELRNRCYGSIGEDAVSPSVYVGEDYVDSLFCTFNIPDPDELWGDQNRNGMHSGSTLCAFDYDGNGQQDLLIGDISAENMRLVYIQDMGDEPDVATSLELNFPEDDIAIDIHVFNAAFYEDLDHDGIRDLIVSPANRNESKDLDVSWFYKNVGTEEAIDFDLQPQGFIQEDMIDVGTISMPRLFDFDADGLHDLLVSNRGRYAVGGIYDESISVYRNIGTTTAPAYQLINTDYMGLNALELGDHLCPAFGDINGDGAQDMVLGGGNGRLHIFLNQATASSPALFTSFDTLLDSVGSILDVGASPIPQLFDFDQDGLLDLIVGERNGNINYLRNDGSLAEADFVQTNDSIGGIVTDLDGNLIGYAAPWLFTQTDGSISALIGTEAGTAYYITSVPSDIDEVWTITDSTAFGIANGERACPIVADIDGDGDFDIINGDVSGGLAYYAGGPLSIDIAEFTLSAPQWTISPNPARDYIWVESQDDSTLGAIGIFDLNGRHVVAIPHNQQNRLRIDLSNLGSGTYILRSTETSKPLGGIPFTIDAK